MVGKTMCFGTHFGVLLQEALLDNTQDLFFPSSVPRDVRWNLGLPATSGQSHPPERVSSLASSLNGSTLDVQIAL